MMTMTAMPWAIVGGRIGPAVAAQGLGGTREGRAGASPSKLLSIGDMRSLSVKNWT